jgi:hypothetical protein
MRLVAPDLGRKHEEMQAAVFPFMRATFYRWCQLWRAHGADERGLARVRAVGDLHLENFGTWRDLEGRLVWGINDFDEATTLGWSQDLVRLATSAHLAIVDEHLQMRRRDACAAILAGYRDGIERGPQPFTLEERHGWLRAVATSRLREPKPFWAKMGALPTARDPDPKAVAALLGALPAPDLPARICRRVAGKGSLGRPRFVALAEWNGGGVAREAKATAPSAWVWASGAAGAPRGPVAACADPTVQHVGRWLVRRLAPQCTRIELPDLPDERDEEKLLAAMGFEVANVHLATPGARARIRRELGARAGSAWLHDLAKVFVEAIDTDWRAFRAG